MGLKSGPVSIAQLFKYSSVSDLILLATGSVCAVICGLTIPILTIAFGSIFDSFVEFTTSADEISTNLLNATSNVTSSYDNSSNAVKDFKNNSYISAGVTLSAGFINCLLSYVFMICLTKSSCGQGHRLKKAIFHSLLRQEVSYLEDISSGSLASNIAADLVNIEAGTGEKIGFLLRSLSLSASSLIVAMIYGWKMTLVCLVFAPFVIATSTILSLFYAKSTEDESLAYHDSCSIITEVLTLIKTVYVFDGQSKEIKRYEDSLIPAMTLGRRRILLTATSVACYWTFTYIIFAIGIWFGVHEMTSGESAMTGGSMFIVFWNIGAIGYFSGQIFPHIEAINVARIAAKNMYKIIERQSVIDPLSTDGLKPPSSSFSLSIELQDVSFSYESRSEIQVLEQVSLNVQPGEVVAIVGSSGSGKSTIVRLIQRIHDTKSGCVKIGGQDIKLLNVSWLRDRISVVGQEPVLFDGKISENIKLGIKSELKMAESDINMMVKEAAVQANADEFIAALPSGYDTMVGGRGCQMSGGQKQRIAIARALISSPSILLLDEATSALDRHSESLVQRSIDLLKSKRKTTIIIVAHRLSTIKNTADRIVVIEKGHLVEEGTHEQLMNIKEGHYRRLFDQQVTSDVGNGKTQLSNGDVASGYINHTNSDDQKIDDREIQVQMTSFKTVIKTRRPWTEVFKLTSSNDKLLIMIGSVTAIVFGLHVACYAVLFGNFASILNLKDNDLMYQSSIKISLFFLVVAIAAGTMSFTTIASFGLIAQRLTLKLRSKVFNAVLNQSAGWFDLPENSVGNLSSRLQDDSATVHFVSGTMTFTVIVSIVSMLACVSLSLALNWKMGLFVLCFVPLLLIGSWMYLKLSEGMILTDDEIRTKSGQMIQEVISCVTTITSLNQQSYFANKFNQLIKTQFKSRIKQSHFRGLIIGFVSSIGTISYGCTFWFGSYLISTGQLNYPDFVVIVEALIFGCVVLADSAIFSVDFKRGKEAVTRLLDLMNLPTEDTNKKLRPPFSGDIYLENVTFSYPSRDKSVLNGVSLTIEPRTSIAFTGTSGSGKSTLIQLLLKLYKPATGSICLDGTDIQEVDTSYWRSKIGLVSQEPMLFSSSIRHNIEYGLNSRNDISMAEVVEAAKKAGIHSFIMSLTHGYETVVGEGGSQLSGGQKQRVSIARALIRRPELLLLDEATSSLDTVTESQIQESLDDESMAGRTSVTVAHRLSTTKDCDKICVFDSGQLIEVGDHNQLMARQGKYYQAFTSTTGTENREIK